MQETEEIIYYFQFPERLGILIDVRPAGRQIEGSETMVRREGKESARAEDYAFINVPGYYPFGIGDWLV